MLIKTVVLGIIDKIIQFSPVYLLSVFMEKFQNNMEKWRPGQLTELRNNLKRYFDKALLYK